MTNIEYFPLGLAEGQAFCNRQDERQILKKNIQFNRPMLITSPRRYGKSSLVLYVLEELQIPYKRVDLFVTLDEATVTKEIIDAVNVLINKVVSKPEQIMSSIKSILKNVNTKWSIGTDGINVELTKHSKKDDAIAIRDILIILDEILKCKKKKVVFFIDEFQEIGIVANSRGIEGAIRSVAEKSKNIAFIFSGSNRHILQNMFDDRSRPLYMLCDKLNIKRIEKACYVNFINDIAKNKWGKTLSTEFFNQLFILTECHPYYVNLICGRLYVNSSKLPCAESINNTWNAYLQEEKSRTSIELGKLSHIQKKLIIMIALGTKNNLSSKENLQHINSTSAGVIKALRSLIVKDYIEELDNSTYQIIDPLIIALIKKYFRKEL